MKRGLLLGCSIACIVLATGAQAEITGKTTTPVRSSTINNNNPGDVSITKNGSIELKDTAGIIAVRLDSNNAVHNAGTISIKNANDATGVQIDGGVTGSVRVSGKIELLEDYARTDVDKDGDLDGPYAVALRQNGIWLKGAGGLTGNIIIEAAGVITVEGNDSAGVRLDSLLNGAFTNDGSISIVGSNSIGVDMRAGVTGGFLQSGNVTAMGENASAIKVLGGVGGAFVNEGIVQATGFASTTLTNYVDPDTLKEGDKPISERIDAEDLLAGGPAIAIGGNVAKGFLNNGAVDDFVSQADKDDTTKDTVEDFDENRSTGTIRSFGSGPAVLVSTELAGSGDIVFGKVVESVRDSLDDDKDGDRAEIIATFSYDEGFINRGSISANGLNVGFNATAVRIEGAADGSRKTIIEGGLRNSGAISAKAFEADAVALSIGRYTQTPQIINSGKIEAGVATEGSNKAQALLIEANADVKAIVNTGSIAAVSRGYAGKATAIADQSGGIETILNQGVISAKFSDDGETNEGLGATVAIDLSSHGAGDGVVITQSWRTPVDDVNGDGTINNGDVLTPSIVGDVLFGAGDDVFNISGGTVEGLVSFGAGNDALTLSNAAMAGTINLGAGVDTISFSNGAFFRGSIVDADGTGSLAVSASAVEFVDSGSLTLSTLNVSGGSELSFLSGDVDELIPLIRATSSAVIASDTTISVNVTEFKNRQRSFLLIQSADLTIVGGDSVDVDLAVNAPAIFKTAIDISDTELRVDLTPKTSADLGLNVNQSAAYSAFLNLAEAKAVVGGALTSYMAEDELVVAYKQLLPDYSDSATRFLSSEASIVNGALARRFDQMHADPDRTQGFWLMEQTAYMREKGDSEAVGFDGFGASFEGGYDRRISDNLALGANIAARIGKYSTPDDVSGETGISAYQIGLYGSGKVGGLMIDATGAAGVATVDSKRIISFGDMLDVYEGKADGSFYSGSARLSYKFAFGSYYLMPAAAIDYFRLHQKEYTETATASDAPLALRVGEATTSRTSGTALVRFGHNGEGGARYQRPQAFSQYYYATTSELRFFQDFYAGYRKAIDEELYNVEVAFAAADGDVFEISDLKGYGDAALFGLSIGAVGDGFTLTFSYDGEFEDSVMTHRVGAAFRLVF
ncbi:MAG: autotransporter domain-containing protein [Pseudomonadota bacterium]|nr:autotransporter domain-containing protein [Pseudomonadota bacterium]